MSWWDSSGLSNFANNVVKSAQKKIDKVLDIDEADGSTSSTPAEATSQPTPKRKKKDEGDFWNSWLGAAGEKKADRTKESSNRQSSSTGSPCEKKAAGSWQSWGFQAQADEVIEDDVESLHRTDLPEYQVQGVVDDRLGTVTTSLEQATSPKTSTKLLPREIIDQPSVALEASGQFRSAETLTKDDPGELTVSQSSGPLSPDISAGDQGSTVLVPEKGIHHITDYEPMQDIDLRDQPSEEISGQKDQPSEESSGQDAGGSDGMDIVISCVSQTEDLLLEEIEIDSKSTVSVCMGGSSDDNITDQEELQVKVGDPCTSWDQTDLGYVEHLPAHDVGMVETADVPGCRQIDINDSISNVSVSDERDSDREEVDYSVMDSGAINTSHGDINGRDILSPTQTFLRGNDSQDLVKTEDTDEESTAEENMENEAMRTNVTNISDTLLDSGDIPERDMTDSDVTLEVLDQSMEKSINSSIEIVTEKEIQAQGEQVKDDDVTEVAVPDLLSHKQEPVVEECSSDWRFPMSGEVTDASPVIPQNYPQPELSPSRLEHSDSSDASRLDSSMDTCISMDTIVRASGESNSDQSLEDYPGYKEEQPPEEDLRDRSKSSDDNIMTGSSSSSIVKNMLEEAMEENLKQEETDNHSHSSSDKSDFVKSEFSDRSISGHESGDEIDTTTSSDIEIISTPTPNGERQERPFDLSPLKIALSRAGRRESPSHRRSDSQSSSSTNSKPGQMSPGRDLEFTEEGREHAMLLDLTGDFRRSSYEEQMYLTGNKMTDLPVLSEEDRNDPYQTDKLLKKMANMAEVINVRESKLVQLSKDNNDLLEANSILRNQLKQAEESLQSEMADLNALTEEFTIRIGDSDKKLQAALREKDSLKKLLDLTKEEMVKKGDTTKFQKLLEEKDQQIKELMAEGEKLSKQQLQGSTIIKKLRTKEKENEQIQQSQKKTLEDQKKELDHLRVVLDSKDDMEKKQTDAIKQLNSAVQKQEKEMARLKGELEENQEKMRSMQVALDSSYKEISELHRANAAKDSKAQEVALSTEMQTREELRTTMEREQLRYRQEKESLIMQIEDLRMSLSRMEKDHGRREDMLRQEISDLHQRLQEDEARNQELTHSVTSATRPLLRQIENLQSTYGAQSNSWERVEKNLTERLGDVQNQLAMAVEKERVANEQLLELGCKVTTLEAQNTRYRQEKSQITAQHEMIKAKLEMLEDARNNEVAQIEAVRHGLGHEINELKREKILMENQLEMERAKMETEKKKTILLQDQLREKEKERPRSRGTPSPATVSMHDSVTSISEPHTPLPIFTQDELLERSLMLASHSPNGNKMTLYETLRQTGAANLLDSLTSQLKQKEGEIIQLQSEIGELERTREAMARELVNLSTQNEDLHEQIEGLPHLKANYHDLEQRYNAILQMYGEKVEETEELKLDLQDVKELYKSQIDHLMKGH